MSEVLCVKDTAGVDGGPAGRWGSGAEAFGLKLCTL